MARNKLNDLRDHLFEMIEQIKDSKDQKELDLVKNKSEAISSVTDTILKTASIEISYLEKTGIEKSDTQFFRHLNDGEEKKTVKRLPSNSKIDKLPDDSDEFFQVDKEKEKKHKEAMKKAEGHEENLSFGGIKP